MSANLKIVHESEVQRQHVRIEVPGSVRIAGNIYKIRDISAGGFSIHADRPVEAAQGARAEFVFPFEGYALQFTAKVQDVSDDRARKTAGFRFPEPEPAQISIISHIVRARMTGTLVDGGDLIGVAARNNFAGPRARAPQGKKGVAAALRRVIPTLLFIVAGLGAAALVGANAYERASVLKSYQGVVETGGDMTVRAQAEGNVRLLLSDAAEKVAKGQAIAVIEKAADAKAGIPAAPAETTITSPCDCNIRQRLVQNGEYRTPGEPLFVLVPSDAAPWVTVLVDPEKAHRLRLQDDASVRIAGEGGFLSGHIMDIGAESLDKPYARVRIKPEKRLALDMTGRPAYAEFFLYK